MDEDMATMAVNHDARSDDAGRIGVVLPTAVLGLLTLGFFVYQLGVASGRIGAFLGGYIGAVTAVLLPFSFVVYLGRNLTTRRGATGAGVILFSFSGVIFLIALMNYRADGYVNTIAVSHFFVVIQFVTMFCTMRDLAIDDARTRRTLVAFAIAGSAIVALLTVVRADPTGASTTGDIADYQQLAIYYILVLFIAAALIERMAARVLLYVIGIVVLFQNGARTEVFSWLLAMIVIEAFRSRRTAALVALAALVLLPTLSVIAALLAEYFPENRVTLLVENTTQDQSYIERKYILDQALQTIMTHPFFGDYARYEPGRYAHNALSVWQDFGLLPFLVFVASLLFATARVVTLYRRGRRDRETLLFAAATVVAVVEFSLSKAFSNPLYPFVMALYARSVVPDRTAI
jgi:O-antigen ligase